MLKRWIQVAIFLVSFAAWIDGAVAWKKASVGGVVSGTVAITNVSSGTPGASTATITATFSPSAGGQLCYGVTVSLGTCLSRGSSVTSYSQALSGLSPSVTYYYQINATAAGYTQGLSIIQSFTTTPLTAVAISSVSSGTPGSTSASITWTNTPAATGQVCYGLTSGYGTCTTRDAVATTSDSALISGLSPSTLYHYQANATATGYSQGFSSDMTFITAASSGTTYYVDYTNSTTTASDSNNGTSTSTPWIHAPGDVRATGTPSTKVLNPGDEVCFKGGESYNGSLQMKTASAGTAAQPIVYEGTCWTGTATMSGYTTAVISCTSDATFAGLSDCILPSALVPGGQSNTYLSASYQIMNINGTVASLGNNSTSSNQWFPGLLGGTTATPSQISGSGSSWTFTPTDATLISRLNALTTAQVQALLFTLHQYTANDDLVMAVTAWNGTSLSLTGAYQYSSTHNVYYLVQNIPNYVSGSNPYPQYAIEYNGTNYYIIANVATGNNTIAVSTFLYAFRNGGSSGYTFDGFTITGYACCSYSAIWWQNVNNLTISNNTINHSSASVSGGAIGISSVTGATITGNTLGPDFPSDIGVKLTECTNCTVTLNTINSPGWDPVFTQGSVNTTISFNRMSNYYNPHGICVTAYGYTTVQAQGITITNNQCTAGPAGIAVEGLPAGSGPDPLPNNFVVTWNVIQQNTYNVSNVYQNVNTATYSGNIAYNNSPISPLSVEATNVLSILFQNDIIDAFPSDSGTLNPNMEINAVTATSANFLSAYPPTIHWNGHLGGAGNAVNTGLNSILATDLAAPGNLSATTCTAIGAGHGQQVGIDWTCP